MNRGGEFLESLDAVIAQVRGLGEFLASPSVVERYFLESQRYYGAKNFPDYAYKAILEQLRQAHEKVPRLSERLWRKLDWQRFTFEFDFERGVARRVNPELWSKYLEEWAARLEPEFHGFYDGDDVDGFLTKAKPILEKASNELLRFEKGSPTENERRDFYKGLRRRPELTRIAAYALWRHVSREPWGRGLLTCEDGDAILSHLKKLRQYGEMALHAEIQQLCGPVTAALRDRIPPPAELLSRQDIFPTRRGKTKDHERTYASETLKGGRYFFEALRRPFHGIWKGIPIKDCLAFEEITPARWGLMAIEGAQAIHIRTNTVYHGSVQIVPVRHVTMQEVWGILEFWSPVLLSRPIVKGEKSGRSEPFAKIIFRELDSRLPEGWKGFCFSAKADGFDNWSVSRFLESGPAYTHGFPLGRADEFVIDDPFAEELASAMPYPARFEWVRRGQMIHAGMPSVPAPSLIKPAIGMLD